MIIGYAHITSRKTARAHMGAGGAVAVSTGSSPSFAVSEITTVHTGSYDDLLAVVTAYAKRQRFYLVRYCDAARAGDRTPCTDDTVQVWHGMATPAVACMFHATYFKNQVFEGHRSREAQS